MTYLLGGKIYDRKCEGRRISKSLPPFYFAKRGVRMADTIDSLQIEINAKATKANDAIDRLVGKLDRLTTSLSKINGTNLNGLANGVQRLGNAVQIMNNIKTADFTRLASNLAKLGSVNVSALNSAASSMSHLTRAFNSLGTVSSNAQAVGEIAKNIAKFGNKSVQTAITNIPQLATALNNLMATLSRSPQVSQNVIQMTNALANLANQGSKVGSASNSIVRGLNRTTTATRKASGGFKGLASYIGKFYATYFMVIRGIKKLWSSIESTADYIEAYNYFNVALGKIGSDWSYQWEQYGYDNAESYAKSFQTRLSDSLGKLSGLQVTLGADGQGLLTESGMKNLGLNIQEITQYASQLASVTNSVGQTGETSLAIAKNFTRLAGDISSLFNVDYSSVSKNLQSGLIGQSRALYKYGIDITNATLQTYAYNLGLSKSVSEMTQAEKMQLRMLAILEQSKVSWGDLANTINSPSNMIRQFKNNLKETGMVLGQLFIPVLQKVLPVINGVTIAIKRLLVNIANLLGVKIDFDAFGQGYTDLEDDIDGITDSYEEAAKAAEEYKNQLLGFDEVNKLSESSDSGIDVGTGGIDLTQQIIDATSEYEKAWQEAYDKMENQAGLLANKFEKMLTPLKDTLEKLFSGDFEGFGEGLSNIWVNNMNTLADAIGNIDWSKVGKAIGSALKGIASNVPALIDGAIELGGAITRGILEGLVASFKEAPLETILLSGAIASKWLLLGNGIGKTVAGNEKTGIIGTLISKLGGVKFTIAVTALITAFSYAKEQANKIFDNYSYDEAMEANDSALGRILVSGSAMISDKYGILQHPDEWAGAVKMMVQDWIDGIEDFLGFGEDEISERVKETFDNAADYILKTSDKTGIQLLAKVKNILAKQGIYLSGTTRDMMNQLIELANNAEPEMQQFLTVVITALNKTLFKSIDDANDYVKKLQDNINGINYSKFGAATKSIFDKLKEYVDGFNLDSIKQKFDDLRQTIKKSLTFEAGVNPATSDKITSSLYGLSLTSKNPLAGLEKLKGTVTFPLLKANGGFVDEGQLFIAREAGPELVGTMGGRTAVVNNPQIIEGIRQAAFEGMSMALANANLNNTANVSVTLQGDANKLFEVVRDKANNYTRTTNRPAFNL